MINVDILMKLEDSKGPIKAESQSRLSNTDDFTSDFKRGMFFDVEEFDFDVSLNDNDDGGGDGDDDKEDKKKKKKKKGGHFARWLGGTRNLKDDGYPVEMQPFQFTRQFDVGSPTLFQLCANSVPLKSAAMVQRKSGGAQNTSGISECFLRLDFIDVLLTTVSWDISDAILKEKVKFVCRSISVQYRAQNEDGSLNPPVYGEWSFNAQGV